MVIKLVESIGYININYNFIIMDLCKSKKSYLLSMTYITPIKNAKRIEIPRNLSCVIMYINTKTIVKYVKGPMTLNNNHKIIFGENNISVLLEKFTWSKFK
jgi:hypothetical protein